MRFFYLFLFFPFLSSAQIKVGITVDIPSTTTDSLFIAGNFNNWNAGDKNFCLAQKDSTTYVINMNLPKGNYEFKVTRGNWKKVETTNIGQAISNRTLVSNVDTSITLRIANWQDNFKQVKEDYSFGDHVHVMDANFYMPQLDKHRKIWIYLPKGYKNSKKKYPVVYMHDGQNLFHASPPRKDEWAVDTVTDSLIRAGLKERIIVGIDHGGDDRLKEYNPYDSKFGKGEGKTYVQFLVETLKPFIDQHYRTLKDTKNTAIAGSSMGGLISMYAITTYPEIFGAAGVFSPSFWLAPQIYDEVTAKITALKNNKIFFVAGDKEGENMVNDVKKLYNLLNPNGTNTKVIFIEKEDGKHTEWFWHREFVPFYEFISK